ncbi:hypothetical protein [Flavisolibacter tropicus]|uniref:hypothetical protein n=1 Tax=Flavisolibacter tropicus TaxID=1492898 RepID=UPI00131423EC|nr:hypothetical protein [Flavisolibacter tropicus]
MTTASLTKTIISNASFENPDGSDINMEIDYCGTKRNRSNPSPGPFEILKSGKQKMKVW